MEWEAKTGNTYRARIMHVMTGNIVYTTQRCMTFTLLYNYSDPENGKRAPPGEDEVLSRR